MKQTNHGAQDAIRGLSTSLRGQRGFTQEITLFDGKIITNLLSQVKGLVLSFVKITGYFRKIKGKLAINQRAGEAPCQGRRAQTIFKSATGSVTLMGCVFSCVPKFWNSWIPEGRRYCCSNSMKSKEMLSFKIKEDRYCAYRLAPKAITQTGQGNLRHWRESQPPTSPPPHGQLKASLTEAIKVSFHRSNALPR